MAVVLIAGVTGGMGSIILGNVIATGKYQRTTPIALLILVDYFGADAPTQDKQQLELKSKCFKMIARRNRGVVGGLEPKKKPTDGDKTPNSPVSSPPLPAEAGKDQIPIVCVHWDASSLDSTTSAMLQIRSATSILHGVLITTGIGFHGDVAKMSLADSHKVLMRQLAVNCVGPSLLCQELAKMMAPQPAPSNPNAINPGGKKLVPTILVLSSFSGLVGLPHRAHYCSSKFGLNGFLEGIHAAYPNTLRIVLVCPTSVSTPFRENWKKEQMKSGAVTSATDAEQMNKADLSPAECVDGVMRAWDAPQKDDFAGSLEYVVLPAGKTKFAAWAVRAPMVSGFVRRSIVNKSKM